MTPGAELLDLADWDQRTPEFGALREHHDGGGKWIVVARFTPADERAAVWHPTRDLWLDLPRHPNLLDAVALDESGTLLLRYAAIDWRAGGIVAVPDARAALTRLATWGLQLADAFSAIAGEVHDRDVGRLFQPLVKFDLRNHVRVGFLPICADDVADSTLIPPELRRRWPHGGDERSLVFLVGALLSTLSLHDDLGLGTPIHAVIGRCLARRARDRFNTLNSVRDAFVRAGGRPRAPARDQGMAWHYVETGIGRLALGQRTLALDSFLDAINCGDETGLGEAGRHRANALISAGRGGPSARNESRLVVVMAEWDEASPAARQREEGRAFADALKIYETIYPDGTNDAALYAAMARCHLELGGAGHAVDYAKRALAIEPGRAATFSTLINAHLVAKQYDAALRAADQLLTLGAAYAFTHYLRGRCLFALKRYMEARDSFERAISLRPRFLEAQLLRREVDRAMKGVRDVVGSQPTLDVGIPEHLVEIRAILINGRPGEAIEALSRAEYAGDPMAQLFRGRMLLSERRFGEAWAVYERIASLGAEHGPSAALGKAIVLLELDRPAEALELFNQIQPQRPNDTELLEGQARALEALGRNAEAADVHRRLADLAAARPLIASSSGPGPRRG